jgi:hypothetical protein
MRKLSGFVQIFLVQVFWIQVFRGDELDGGPLRFPAGPLGEKYGAVIRASQPLPQGELPIDYPAFPLFPEFGRSAHRPRLGESLFYSSNGASAL